MKNLPDAFLDSMKSVLPDHYAEFLESLNGPVPVSIRYNAKKLLPAKTADPVPWAQHGAYLASRPSFTLDPLFHAGAYYVQEASSMFLEQAVTQNVPADTALNVLDLSAAPGGKSTHLLSLLHEDSLLVSNDVIRPRAAVLSENLKKWGYANVMVTSNDPGDFSDLHGFFDLIVIDAPCSGEGLFRKDPSAIAEWSAQNVELCCRRQKRILADVWPALKKNGTLIYCTCTYNERENEKNMEWLDQHHGLEFQRLRIDPSWGVAEVRHGNVIGYRLFPHRVKGEGFFLSVARKQEQQAELMPGIKAPMTRTAENFSTPVRSWIRDADRFRFIRQGDAFTMIPGVSSGAMEFLIDKLRVLHAGTAVAAVKHGKSIPGHTLAMSIHLDKNTFNTIHLSRAQAISYLRREVPPLTADAKGYHLVMFESVPLGWINNLGNRYNNLYPTEWRIRMSADSKTTGSGNPPGRDSALL